MRTGFLYAGWRWGGWFGFVDGIVAVFMFCCYCVFFYVFFILFFSFLIVIVFVVPFIFSRFCFFGENENHKLGFRAIIDERK